MSNSQTSGSPVGDPQSLATAPAATLANLYAAVGQALGDAAKNAVAAQQQAQMTAQAAITQGVATLLSIDTAAIGMAAEKELNKR